MFNPTTPEPVLQHSYATASSVAWTISEICSSGTTLSSREGLETDGISLKSCNPV